MGSIVGAPTGGALADRCGRRPILLLGQIPFLVSWAMVANAGSYPWVLAARALSGFADGVTYPLLGVYISEVSTADSRGRGGIF